MIKDSESSPFFGGLSEVIGSVERRKQRQSDAEFIESARTWHGETWEPPLTEYRAAAEERLRDLRRRSTPLGAPHHGS